MYTKISLNAYSFGVNLSFWYQYIDANITKLLTNNSSMFINVKVTLSSILANTYNRVCGSDSPMTVTTSFTNMITGVIIKSSWLAGS